jgi:hypothetical protein
MWGARSSGKMDIVTLRDAGLVDEQDRIHLQVRSRCGLVQNLALSLDPVADPAPSVVLYQAVPGVAAGTAGGYARLHGQLDDAGRNLIMTGAALRHNDEWIILSEQFVSHWRDNHYCDASIMSPYHKDDISIDLPVMLPIIQPGVYPLMIYAIDGAGQFATHEAQFEILEGLPVQNTDVNFPLLARLGVAQCLQEPVQ